METSTVMKGKRSWDVDSSVQLHSPFSCRQLLQATQQQLFAGPDPPLREQVKDGNPLQCIFHHPGERIPVKQS